MTQIKSMICVVVIIITISSTALAGNISSRTGNISSRTGNIPSRSGNISSRTGNIPSRSGNIASRTGIVPTDSANSGSPFDFSENIGRLIQLLLASGLY